MFTLEQINRYPHCGSANGLPGCKGIAIELKNIAVTAYNSVRELDF